MKIYKCTVGYRHHGDNGPVFCKVLFIKADDPIAAYIKARQETKGLHEADKPEIEEFIMPHIDFTCTKEQMIREYGTKVLKKAEKHLLDETIEKTRDGSKREYLY